MIATLERSIAMLPDGSFPRVESRAKRRKEFDAAVTVLGLAP